MIKSILLSEAKMSRRMVRHLAQTNQVLRNGAPVFLTARAVLGDEIYVMLPKEDSSVEPEQMRLDIRYEDEEFIVINKPAGILTHPTAREKTGSLLAGVRAYLGGSVVPHCVHRLDRQTSGLVILAKHAHAHQLLDRALRQGQVHRVYHALALGFPQELQTPFLHTPEWQTIDLPIAQDPEKPSRRIVSPDGQRAVTHYRIVAAQHGVGLLQIVLETGKTHQIRLHLASIGHPLLGDGDYNMSYFLSNRPEKSTAERMENGGLVRHALHATQLGWRHPVSGQFHVVTAEPPSDIQQGWSNLTGKMVDWSFLANDVSGLQRVEMLSSNLLR